MHTRSVNLGQVRLADSKRYMHRLVPMLLFFLHWNIIAPFCCILIHGVVILVCPSVRVGLHLLLIFIIHASIHLRAHHMTVHVLVLQVAYHKMWASEVGIAL